MLIKRLMEVHGSGHTTEMVIKNEVEKSNVLMVGKLTPGGLTKLERDVAAAVQASKPSRQEVLKPPPRYARDMPAGELADRVKANSTWTAVDAHRASYYNIEQQRKLQEKEQKKLVLREHMMHQMSLDQHTRQAERAMLSEEAKQVAIEMAAFERDEVKRHAQKHAKMEAERKARDAQMREQAARASAAERLRQLEDEEMLDFLRKEQEKDAARKREKQLANDKYHRETAIANVEARKRRDEEQQKAWAEEAKFNAEWKAILDKQEADRNAQYSKLRERIHAMQRVYESSAGADLQRRLDEEERTRDAWIAAHEKALDEEADKKKAKRKAQNEATTAFLANQISIREKAKQEEVEWNKRYAAQVRADALVEAENEEKKRALARAKAQQQQVHLNRQVIEQREQAARDPGSSEMTDLEATLNRGLLVSVVQHQYNDAQSRGILG